MRWLNFTEVNSKKNAEIFTNKVSRVYESARNNSLFWKAVSDVTPNAWRVIANTSSSGSLRTEYLSGTTWVLIDDPDFTFDVTENGYEITKLGCNNTTDVVDADLTVNFSWALLSFQDWCGANDWILEIDTRFLNYTWSVILNTTSWVIESSN